MFASCYRVTHILSLANYVIIRHFSQFSMYVEWDGFLAEMTGGRAEVEEVGHPLGFNCKFFLSGLRS